VRVHRDEPALVGRLLNVPLDVNHGELLRFDLIRRDGGGAKLLFTWAHALMDAPSAEQLLAVIGNEKLPLPAAEAPPRLRSPELKLRERFKLAWKNIHQMDRFCEAAPRTPGVRHPAASAGMCHRVEKFSADETARIRAHSARLCGLLGDAQFHAVVSVLELHRLHQRLGCESPSYVLPVPVGMRRKGSIEPLFSNQVAMLMLQFLPAQLDSAAAAVAALKEQTAQAMRDGLVESGLILSELFRFLPVPIYMAVLKQGLRGEICSLFYGDTAAVTPRLNEFLGAPVVDFAHAAAVTPSPGLGVIFYYFRNELRVTVLNSARALNENEATEFAAGLRARLLDP
jgi:hypothetical protein